MKTHCRFWTFVGVALVVGAGSLGSGSGQHPKEKADQSPEKNVKTEPPPSELGVLGTLLGTRGPSTNDFTAMTAKWALSGTYLQIDKHFNDEAIIATMTFLTWDQKRKVYRCWQFGRLDGGSPQQGEGRWDDTSNTLRFVCAADSEGRTLILAYMVSVYRLTYKEATEDKAGKVKQDLLTCEWVRRKD